MGEDGLQCAGDVNGRPAACDRGRLPTGYRRQPMSSPIFVLQRDQAPSLTPEHPGEQPAGIHGSHAASAGGERREPQPPGLTGFGQPEPACLGVERKQAVPMPQVHRRDVAQRRLFPGSILNTSRLARSELLVCTGPKGLLV